MQVHPQKLTTALMAAAEAAAGARVVHGTVCGILRRADGAATAVRVQLRHQKQQQQQPAQGSVEDLPADVVVLAMGPWTGAARAWLPSAPATSGQKVLTWQLPIAPQLHCKATLPCCNPKPAQHCLVLLFPTPACLPACLPMQSCGAVPQRCAAAAATGGRLHDLYVVPDS